MRKKTFSNMLPSNPQRVEFNVMHSDWQRVAQSGHYYVILHLENIVVQLRYCDAAGHVRIT